MNIAQAKRNVLDTIEAYMAVDEDGMPLIPADKQRPLFLLGAPGIGKTAIMSQIANELGVGLVSYSMTHHTRQSALGLPLIVHHNYEGFEYDSSDYTMSEIVSSIYDYMAETGLQRGILFLDEINCVSETLYPSMLQFLQFKTFGRHSVPEGWVVACAGNPPEYNRSVHEFDIVTLDRLRTIEVEPDYETWKAYAADAGVHPAVLSFLETKKDCFYKVESTPNGKIFVTARGWEDLSRIITLFERVDKPVDRTLAEQFLRDSEIAERFTLHYELFRKYRSDYKVTEILDGGAPAEIMQRAMDAAFDERLALLSMMVDIAAAETNDVLTQEKVLSDVRDILRTAKQPILDGEAAAPMLKAEADEATKRIAYLKETKTASTVEMRVAKRKQAMLLECEEALALSGMESGQEAFDAIHQQFRGYVGAFEASVGATRQHLENAFEFIEEAFGDAREMLVWMTELTARRSTSLFISRYGCKGFERHSSDMQVDEHRKDLAGRIAGEMAAAEQARAGGAAVAETDSQPEAVNLPGSGELGEYYAKANWEYGYASLCHMALPGGLSGFTVVDLGCRRGKGVFKLSERVGERGRAIGIDWTPEHIKEASEKSERAAYETGLPANNMEFYLAYPEDLVAVGLGDRTVDMVFINSILHLTYKPEMVISEVARVLKPGGIFVAEVALADADRDPEVVAQARELGNSVQAAMSFDHFKALLEAAGFDEVEVQTSEPVDADMGFKKGHTVPTVPTDEAVNFNATVINAKMGKGAHPYQDFWNNLGYINGMDVIPPFGG